MSDLLEFDGPAWLRPTAEETIAKYYSDRKRQFRGVALENAPASNAPDSAGGQNSGPDSQHIGSGGESE